MIWWYNLTSNEQFLYIIASISSALLTLDLFFYLTGLKSGKTGRNNGILYFLLNFRSFLILLSVGSWTTIISYKSIRHFVPSGIIGLVTGIVIAVMFAVCIKYVLNLNCLPKVSLETLIGSEGVVYSLIPPKGEGRGKVSVMVDDKMRVFEAIAYEDNKIQSGSDIKVIDSLGSDLLLVERIKEGV